MRGCQLDWSRFVSYALMPLKAILSQRFYYDVLFKLKGVGLVYVLVLCAVLALPGTYQVKQALNKLQSWELSSVVAKLPPSFISPDGTLSPNNPQDGAQPLIVRNSKGNAVLAYNLNDLPLNANAVNDPERPVGANLGDSLIEVPISFSAQNLILNTVDGVIAIPWTTVYGEGGGSFEPLATAQVFESAFRSSYFALWGMVSAWLMSIICLVVLIAACLFKPLCSIFFKLKISFATALRLNAFGSTLVAVLLLLQFFHNFSLSYMTLCLIPLLYSGMLMMQVRKHLRLAKDNIERALNPQHPLYPMFDLFSRLGSDQKVDQGPDYSALDETGKQKRRANLKRNLDLINVIVHEGQYPFSQPGQGATGPMADNGGQGEKREDEAPRTDIKRQEPSPDNQEPRREDDPWAQLDKQGKDEGERKDKDQGGTFIP